MNLDIPPVPLLFVLPLALYLLSFILVFSSDRWNSSGRNLFLALCATSAVCFELFSNTTLTLVVRISIYCFSLFCLCLYCHQEVVKRKPDVSYLMIFYILIAFGGAVGSVFVNLLAPVIFVSYLEYEISVFIIFSLCMFSYCKYLIQITQPKTAAILVSVFGVYFICLLMLFFSYNYRVERSQALEQSRSLYGILRVFELESENERLSKRALYHGGIQHGVQYLHPEKQHWKTSYYGGNSGLEIVINNHPKRNNPKYPFRIGGIGLGVGTIAAYGNDIKWSEDKYPIQNDFIHFYEINPDVVDIANRQFTFLNHARLRGADVQVSLGDARLVMQSQADENDFQEFDILAVDAFSGDAIPMHLLTIEAMQLYLKHLKSDGVLAVHISNQFLDLSPVLRSHAKNLDKAFYVKAGEGDYYGNDPTSWIILTSNTHLLESPLLGYDLNAIHGPEVVWTDDDSSLISVLRR